MTQNEVYKLIRSLKSCKKIIEEDTFYSIDDKNILLFEYIHSERSVLSFVCPKDENGDFILIEITENGTDFTQIKKSGESYIPLDLSTEDNFFQTSTIIDLGFTFEDLCDIRMSFLKYYNGFLDEMTIYI